MSNEYSLYERMEDPVDDECSQWNDDFVNGLKAKVAALEGEVLDLKAVDKMRCIGLENKRIRINKQNACIEDLEAKVEKLTAALEVCHVPVKRLTKENAALEDELTNLLDKVGDLPREWRVLFEQEKT